MAAGERGRSGVIGAISRVARDRVIPAICRSGNAQMATARKADDRCVFDAPKDGCYEVTL